VVPRPTGGPADSKLTNGKGSGHKQGLLKPEKFEKKRCHQKGRGKRPTADQNRGRKKSKSGGVGRRRKGWVATERMGKKTASSRQGNCSNEGSQESKERGNGIGGGHIRAALALGGKNKNTHRKNMHIVDSGKASETRKSRGFAKGREFTCALGNRTLALEILRAVGGLTGSTKKRTQMRIREKR